jgi:hypothetical protein
LVLASQLDGQRHEGLVGRLQGQGELVVGRQVEAVKRPGQPPACFATAGPLAVPPD